MIRFTDAYVRQQLHNIPATSANVTAAYAMAPTRGRYGFHYLAKKRRDT